TPDTSEKRDVVDRDTFGAQVTEGLLGLPFCLNHDKKAEVGRLVAFDVDDVGLFCVWRLHDDDQFPQGTALLEQLQADMEAGTFAGLSAAYRAVGHKTHKDGTSRHVTMATL